MLSTFGSDSQSSFSTTLHTSNTGTLGYAATSALTTSQTNLDIALQSPNLLGRASASGNLSYDVNALATAIVTPGGNTISSATNLGVLSSTQTIYDTLGVSSSRPNSYYRLTLNTVSDFNLALTDLMADADVRLLNSAGFTIASSLLYGYTQDEAINVASLAAGEYYIQVNQYQGSTDFTLNLSTNAVSNLLPNEFELGNVGTGTILQTGSISNSNTSDVYHFSSLASSSNFNLSLYGLSDDAEVRVIRDSNNNGIVDAGESLTQSVQFGASSEAISLQGLGMGSYFVQVYQGSLNSSTSYSLSVQGMPSLGSAPEPNNSISQAFDLSTLNGTRHFSGFVNQVAPIFGSFVTGDLADFYRFNLGTTSNFSVSLTGLTANADVQVIRDANNNGLVDSGEVIASSTLAGSSSELLNIQGLGSGDYFVRVNAPQVGTSTNYNLNLQASPGFGVPPSPGYVGTVDTLNGLRSFGGSISDRRPSDWYSFNLGATSNFNLDLTGLTGNLNVQVYRDLNNNGFVESNEFIAESARLGSLSEAINLQGLSAGNYFVRVAQATSSFDDYSNYILSLQATPPNTSLPLVTV
ncbi:MAG: PPC domain-containing protein [Leptolyngbyaceae cyanobacterium bins.302]|nr:PPC domain-containing protein [Leptolyngbyaceae cyanobacterium bins.302]